VEVLRVNVIMSVIGAIILLVLYRLMMGRPRSV